MSAPPQDKVDFIPRIKSLTAQIQECVNNTTRTAAQAIAIGNLVDSGSLTKLDTLQNPPRFDKHVEQLFAVCDQIEYLLKTAIDSHRQGASSARYLNFPVIPTRVEPGPVPEGNGISYPQYLLNFHQPYVFVVESNNYLSLSSEVQHVDGIKNSDL